MFKHQTNCYRNIGGIKYKNYADLIYGDKENKAVIQEAKAKFGKVKIITHWSKEYKQLFVADEK
jgi:hypothetical protein